MTFSLLFRNKYPRQMSNLNIPHTCLAMSWASLYSGFHCLWFSVPVKISISSPEPLFRAAGRVNNVSQICDHQDEDAGGLGRQCSHTPEELGEESPGMIARLCRELHSWLCRNWDLHILTTARTLSEGVQMVIWGTVAFTDVGSGTIMFSTSKSLSVLQIIFLFFHVQ